MPVAGFSALDGRKAVGRRVALMVAMLALAGCHLLDDLFKGDERSITRAWFTPIPIAGDYNTFGGMPAVARGVVVAAVPGGLVALDTATGQQRWRTAIINTQWSPKATVIARDSLVCLVDPSVVGCVSLATGAVQWKETSDTMGAATGAADARALYVPRVHSVAARSLADGHLLWATDLAPSAAYRSGPGGIAVQGDTVYVSAVHALDSLQHESRGDLFALDARDGHVLWTHQIDPAPGQPRAQLVAPPVIDGDRAIVAEIHGAWLIAVDVRTGSEVWRTAADPSGYVEALTAPTIVGDTLFVGSSDTQFYALDRRSGKMYWRSRVPFSINAASICGRDALLVPFGGGHLWAVDRGTYAVSKLGITEDGDDVESQVAVSAGTAYVMSMRGMYALRCR